MPLVVWGDLESIWYRIEEHWSAGADYVGLQVLTADPDALPLAEWRTLAALIEP
jgi:hypothetical protein